MFDSLRDQSNNDSAQHEADSLSGDPGFDTPSAPSLAGSSLLGMTAAQRLIIAVMLLVSVCVLGTLCLLITGRIGLG